MKKRFTIVDYAIIILVICAVVFAFIHITSDDDSASESTSYDSSTLNKIVEKYLTYYRQGFIVDTTIHGFNSSDGKPVTLNGNIVWMDDERGSNVKALVNCNGTNYIAGLYNHIPNADIYIDSMTLEMNGDKYSNLTQFNIKPKNISSIDDLVSGIPENASYEITTTISVDSVKTTVFQEINNLLYQNSERISVKATNTGYSDQITLVRATNTEISQTSPIIGEFNGITGEITLRIYNSSDSDINTIKNNFDVNNIQKF